MQNYSANSMSETTKQKHDTKESIRSANAGISRIVLSKETVSYETTARYRLKKETRLLRFLNGIPQIS